VHKTAADVHKLLARRALADAQGGQLLALLDALGGVFKH
jgi:hypothetical protein